MTKLFQTAVRFPLLSARPNTWIYAVWVSSAFNTHARQVLQGIELLKDKVRYANLSEQQVKDTLWSLFGEEMVVRQVPSHHVIAAVQCQRMNVQDLKDWHKAIQYQLSGPLWINPQCGVEDSIRRAALKFLVKELTENRAGQSTVAVSGFTKSALT